jgi:hypothetical protein
MNIELDELKAQAAESIAAQKANQATCTRRWALRRRPQRYP